MLKKCICKKKDEWNKRYYHGRYNKYPFTEVVAFVMKTYGSVQDRTKIRILDLGCGGAHHLLFLAKEGFDYYGIDGSSESIQMASEQLKVNGFNAEHVIVGSIDDLPYNDGYFDCVIERATLTCNPFEGLSSIINQIHRVLKLGGKFFSMILHETSTAKNWANALGNNDYSELKGRLDGAGIIHFTNAGEIQKLCSKFHIDNIELLSRSSQYCHAKDDDIDAWMITTCTKKGAV